ncbi:MAG: hypothetical protein K5853_07250, partial [Lachnospiraceae bacterium]|nr:hypothetical protein [Lachnospiraceae bacterium]
QKPESGGRYILSTLLEAALLVGWLLMPYVRIPAWTVYSAGWMLPNVFLLTVFFFGKGALSKLFCHNGFVYAGNLAFFCFLIHQSVIRFVENAFGERLLFSHGAKTSDWVTAGAVLLITLLLSAAARVADRRIRKAFS